MEKLPVETLFQIFQLACTDGGYTGCSLSQTSRAVRAASYPTRFHSVALSTGYNRLESFINLHQKLCLVENDTRPRISHLHLHDEEEDREHINQPASPSLRLAQPLAGGDSLVSRYSQAVRLLHLIADDLVSLVLPSSGMISSPTGDVQFADHPFPSLKALIVNVPFDKCSSALTTAAVSPLFPALTHVHLVMAHRSDVSLQPFSTWYAHAPRTTHLRISFCPLNSRKEMRLLLGTPTYPHRRGRGPPPVLPPPATRSWPSVRHVAIQPVPDPDILGLPCGHMGQIYWSLRSELSWMVKWANTEAVFESARVLEPRPSRFCPSPVWISRSSREWRVDVRAAWERIVTHGVDSDWLTFGEEDEPSDDSE